MFQGRYLRWNPLDQFEGKRMYCEAVHDDWEGFRIWLSPESPSGMLVVRFSSVLFYANKVFHWTLLRRAGELWRQASQKHRYPIMVDINNRGILMRFIKIIFGLVALGVAFTSVTNASPPSGSNNMLIEKSHDGYRLSVETPYKFNDQVTFASEYNGSGSGAIVAIDIALDGSITYTIEMPDTTWQPGIAADEITLISSAPNDP